MSTYQERKAARTALFAQNHGRKMITCTACCGSGHYDSHGSPACGGCNGRGKTLAPPPSQPPTQQDWREAFKLKRARAALRKAAGL